MFDNGILSDNYETNPEISRMKEIEERLRGSPLHRANSRDRRKTFVLHTARARRRERGFNN